MPRATTPSFVVELPLQVSETDARVLSVRLEAARQVYNACLGEALRAARRMRDSREWQRARACLRINHVVTDEAARLATSLPGSALAGPDSHPLDGYSEFQGGIVNSPCLVASHERTLPG
jgi:hypothetical protein